MTNNKKLVLYHANCLDGFGSAYAAWCKFGDSADYIPVHYGNAPPDVKDKEIYIVDFSYKSEQLMNLVDAGNKVMVIDHHKTALPELESAAELCDWQDFNYVFDLNKSGCVLSWEYFMLNVYIPYGLMMIQDRDLWKFNDANTKPFTAALKSFVPEKFESWQYVFNNESKFNSIIDQGKDLIEVFDKDVAELAKKQHKMAFDKACCYMSVCNAPAKYASELGNVLAKQAGSMAAIYAYDGSRQEWQFSLRSIDDFDVSVIAKVYGGGGHKNAAGFSVKRLELL